MTDHEFDCLCGTCLPAMLDRVNSQLNRSDDPWLYWIQSAIPEIQRLRALETHLAQENLDLQDLLIAYQNSAWERSERD